MGTESANESVLAGVQVSHNPIEGDERPSCPVVCPELLLTMFEWRMPSVVQQMTNLMG